MDKMKNTQSNKMEDGKFKKKNIQHSPVDESSRAKFGAHDKKHLD